MLLEISELEQSDDGRSYFVITFQAHRGNDVGTYGTFQASNGVKLTSIDNPDWIGVIPCLYLRGRLTGRDMWPIYVTPEEYSRIAAAVHEYNLLGSKSLSEVVYND